MTQPLLPGRKKLVLAVYIVIGVLLLMFVTNPTSNGFKKYIQEYIQTQSGATLEPRKDMPVPDFQRANYYLFSSYTTSIAGTPYEYLGIFGTFKKY